MVLNKWLFSIFSYFYFCYSSEWNPREADDLIDLIERYEEGQDITSRSESKPRKRKERYYESESDSESESEEEKKEKRKNRIKERQKKEERKTKQPKDEIDELTEKMAQMKIQMAKMNNTQ